LLARGCELVYSPHKSVVVSVFGIRRDIEDVIYSVNDKLFPTNIAIESSHFVQPNKYGKIILKPKWQNKDVNPGEIVVDDVQYGKHRMKKSIQCKCKTRKGDRCGNKTLDASMKCWRHKSCSIAW
jgi:hypothetical protein